MLGGNLVVHAVKTLFYDVWATARLTLLPMVVGYGIATIVVYLLAGDSFFALMDSATDVPTQTGISFLLAYVVVLLAFCWAAIGWHRFVLLDEQPGAFLPKFSGPSFGFYVWAVFRLVLASICLLIPILLITLALAGIGSLIQPVMLIVIVAMYTIILRFSLILPGAAIGKPMSLMQSWNVTKGHFATIFVVAVLSVVFGFLDFWQNWFCCLEMWD